jgi:hypothetical protein
MVFLHKVLIFTKKIWSVYNLLNPKKVKPFKKLMNTTSPVNSDE